MKLLATTLFTLLTLFGFSQTYSATDSVMVVGINQSGFNNNSRGFEFTPNTDLTLTHMGLRIPGTTGTYTWVIFETASQTIVHQQPVTIVPTIGVWEYEPISAPVTLNQGTNYILILNHQGTQSTPYYYETNNQVNFNLTYVQMRYCNSCGPTTFPSSTLNNYHYGTPDFLFNTCATPNQVTLNETACDSYLSPSGNYNWTSSGTYVDTVTGPGCDTIYTINLAIKNTTMSSINVTDCDSIYTSPSGNYTWTSAGTYYDTISNSAGCDSIMTINLTFASPTYGTQTESAIDMYTWPLNGQTYTTSGTYVDTIQNSAGCDSIVTLNLTVEYTGIEEGILSNLTIYPNPASNHINVSVPEELLGTNFKIYDNKGKVVLSGKLEQSEIKIEIDEWANGAYILHVNGAFEKSFRIVKE